MSYLRKIAVNAVNEKGYSPEDVIGILGLSRRCIYDWMNRFRDHGYDGLDTQKAPGAEPVVTKVMDDWLKETVLNSTPEDFGYDTNLCSTLAIFASEEGAVRSCRKRRRDGRQCSMNWRQRGAGGIV